MNKYASNSIAKNKHKSGNQGVWWHEGNSGPLSKIPFISQFGSMKFSKVSIDDTMRPHLNDGIEIHYVASGKYDWVIEGKKIELLPENLSITAPWHENGSLSGKMDIGQISWIIIKPFNYSKTSALELGNWSKLPQQFQKNIGELIADEKNVVLHKAKNFKKHFEEIRNELTYQEEGFEIKVQNILENFFIDLHRHLSNQKQKNIESDSFIDKLTQLIMTDLNKKWLIDDLADFFGMGKTKFTYEVKRLTGFPPNSFIISLKLDKSLSLIQKKKPVTMTEIAFVCGFSSLQHFTNTFSQRNGISPKKHQNLYKKNRVLK